VVVGEGGGEVIVELNPAPKEAIDLLEKVHQLEGELQQTKADLDVIMMGLQGLKRNTEELEIHLGKEISEDRKRIRALETILELTNQAKLKPQPRQDNQAALLNMMLINAYPQWNHIEVFREKMGLPPGEFSRLLRIMKSGVKGQRRPHPSGCG